MINVEVIHKEIIKPSSPTPHHLRYLPLSVFDQFKYEIYLPHVVFYPSSSEEHSLVAEKSELLKKSLSEALTQFYPFAGEFKYNDSINCDDRGAVFLEAQVEENEANDLQILVAKLRKSVEELKVKHTNEIRAEDVVQFFKEYGELIEKDDMDNYTCSSLCRFPFCSANFGWGKPSCTRFPLTEVFKNMFLLSDATDGNGIEAYLSMKEEDMVMFETNQDLLTYASLQ
ncbi:vinorine synthase-like [Pyrus ussuriensis x Pyrus communis]|uniref:Vinorine synthase-like n=1 Tax=Pyrus ussuriensis x Pyrus communis TaxID=2448454 RepID=A0A5N5FHJ2_9ROSA|nr:vinorine synthase-like [Pyrus ussuriensis x Pyrus communis]